MNCVLEIYDDDIDFLFTGVNSENNTMTSNGLLYYCGLNSEKHDGQLKRICAPAIHLLRWLITFKGYDEKNGHNIFYDRFIQLPEKEYLKLNFSKHIITIDKDMNLLKVAGMKGESRSGNYEDAMEILSYIVRDHKGVNGEPDPIELNYLIENNRTCRDKFLKWLQKTATAQMNVNNFSLENISNKKPIKIERPKTWEALHFKPVPLQEDEMGVLKDMDEGSADFKAPVPDPLGLQEVDLRVAQEVHESTVKATTTERSKGDRKSALNPSDRIAIMAKLERDERGDSLLHSANASSDGYDEVPEEKSENILESLLPTEKTFNPTLFLTFIHGNTTFTELMAGSKNLETTLTQQSSRRVNIVREHFGLFVLCAESLEWLKLVRKSGGDSLNDDDRDENGLGSIGSRLIRAQGYLNSAKLEAQSALAPLLFRHKRSKEIRKAEQDLRNISSVVDVPHKLQKAFSDGNFEEVVSIYSKVVKMARAKAPNDKSASSQIIDRIKAKAEGIMEDLKTRCETAMKRENLVPDVDSIVRYWKVLSMYVAVIEGGETDAEAHVEYLRSSFDHHIAQFTSLFQMSFDDMQAAGAQVLLEGQTMNIDPSSLAKSPSKLIYSKLMRDFEDGARRKRSSKEDMLSETSDSVDGEEEFTDFETMTDAQSPSENGTKDFGDRSKKLCGEIRLATLRRIVDTLEQWLPSMHSLAILVNSTVQKVSSGGKRAGASTAKAPTTTILARELFKVSTFCLNLLKGFNDNITSLYTCTGTTILGHAYFTMPIPSKFLTLAYDEIFSVFELISGLSLAASNDTNKSPFKGLAMQPKPVYHETLSLLKDLSVEGEHLLVHSTLRKYEQRLYALAMLLDRAAEIQNENYVKGERGSLPIFKTVIDFEYVTLRALKKLYSKSNRPEWIIEIVKEGILRGFYKLLGALDKVTLQFEHNDCQIMQHSVGIGEIDVDRIELLLAESDTLVSELVYQRIFDAIRACVYMRLHLIPKILNEILVTRIDSLEEVQYTRPRRQSFAMEETEVASQKMIGAIDEYSNEVIKLEGTIVVRYLELKSWEIRCRFSSIYFNLVAHYADYDANVVDFPLANLMLLLIHERDRLQEVFSLGSLLTTIDGASFSEMKSTDISDYSYILFTELCKQMASFYVDLVVAFFTGTIFNILDIKSSNGITLALWNRKEIKARRKSDIDRLIIPKMGVRSRLNPLSTNFPYPLLFERVVCESNYFGKITKQMIEKSEELLNEVHFKCIPTSEVQIQVDNDAFTGVNATGPDESENLAERLRPLSILFA